MSKIQVLISKGNDIRDVSEIVTEVNWGGRKGSAARTLSVTLLDDDGYSHGRYSLNVMEGHYCIFKYDKKTLFQGLIMSTSQGDGKKLKFNAYDKGIYLANNKGTFKFENKTLSDVFTSVCGRYGIAIGTHDKTSYKIPELSKSMTTPWDVLCDALEQDFKAQNIRRYIHFMDGKIHLLERRKHTVRWNVAVGSNIKSYSFDTSIEKVRTGIKMISKENTVVAQKNNPELEKKIGTFWDMQKADDSMSSEQLNLTMAATLRELNSPKKALSITALGNPEVYAGKAVYVTIPHLGISRSFYVDEDNHTFDGGDHHMMKLSLSWCNDF